MLLYKPSQGSTAHLRGTSAGAEPGFARAQLRSSVEGSPWASVSPRACAGV